jgi:hypothetical protein
MMLKIITEIATDILSAFTGTFLGLWLFAEKDNEKRKAKIYRVLFLISLLLNTISVIIQIKFINN